MSELLPTLLVCLRHFELSAIIISLLSLANAVKIWRKYSLFHRNLIILVSQTVFDAGLQLICQLTICVGAIFDQRIDCK